MTHLMILAFLLAPQSPAPRASGAPFVDAQSATPVQASGSQAEVAPVAPVEPWAGRIQDGLAEVRRLVEARESDSARALCERLVAPTPLLRWKEEALQRPGWRRSVARIAEPALDFFGAEALSQPARAEVRYAGGLASVAGDDAPAAENAFAAAQALAGPGELRLAAGYQLATVALLEAEALRAKIPEIQEKNGGAGAPAASQPPMPSVPGAQQEPDPLQLARAAYLRAREKFAARLAADWRDADTRANTELVMKRLKELDELEKQRKEQEQQQEREENQDPKQQEDSKDEQKQKDEQKDPKDQDEKPPEPKPEDEPKPDEQENEKDPKDEKKEEQAPKPGEEKELSKEEMQRLFDLLEQREEQWKKLQKQLQQARRAKVKKDW